MNRMTGIKMVRMWINQPSTFQPLHHLHGTNVLATLTKSDKVAQVYFLSGPVISQNVPKNTLSMGWINHVIRQK